ncbi:MAG: SIMPL domain-containing protein [Litorilinea sp.]
MQSKTVRSLTTLVIAATVVLGLAFASIGGYLQTPTAGAQTESNSLGVPTRSITVVGAGTVNIRPDVAHVQIGVETMRASVQEASSENREALDSVLAALLDQGIAESDIQTSGFSVFAERYGPEGPLADEEMNYRVTNTVRIVVHDLDNVGQILDAAIEAGANNIYGVEFALDDTDEVESQARAEAIENARVKAEELAGLSEVSVGRVIAISEIVGGGFYPMAEGRMMSMGGGGGTSIAPGELEITLQLQVVYELVD